MIKRKNNRLYVFILSLFIATSFTFAQSGKEQEIIKLKEIIDSKNYKIDVNMAFPRRGKSIYLTSDYSLGIKKDSVFSYLPFYGRAYSIPYGGGDGLIFSAPIKDYQVTYNKKKAEHG